MIFFRKITWVQTLPAMATFATAVGAGLVLAYWALQYAPANAHISPPDQPLPLQVDASALARALGATQAATAPDSVVAAPEQESQPLVLTGVVQVGRERGAALIAINGAPAQPFRVGAVVHEAWVLQSVQAGQVTLHQVDAATSATRPAQQMVLQLPPRP